MKLTPPHTITIAGKPLPLIISKRARARNMVLRYDAKHHAVKLTLPRYVSVARGVIFAQSKHDWIAAQTGREHLPALADGAVIDLFGERLRIVHVGGRGSVAREGDTLYVAGDNAFLVRRLSDYIKKEMHALCKQRALFHAAKIGVQVKSITLRDTSSRWGSCSTSGGLSFSLRLAHMPLEALDYVVCHEVAHLKHHNHSKAFWQVVEQLCPEWERQESRLKTTD